MKKIVAIVGSRRKWFKDPDKAKGVVRGILWSLPPGTRVMTGDEPTGVDSWVKEIVEEEGVPVVVDSKRAEWGRLGLWAGPARNTEVIEDAHEVHVIWNGSSPGSGDVIKKVRWIQETYATKTLIEHVVC